MNVENPDKDRDWMTERMREELKKSRETEERTMNSVKNITTNRDLFAAMALQGLLSAGEDMNQESDLKTTNDVARQAIEYADALLEELNNGANNEGS